MKTNAQAHQLIIDGDIIPVTPHQDHEYTATTDRVAIGYGVSQANIRKTLQRHRDELVDGKHYYIEVTRGVSRRPTAEELLQIEKVTGGMFNASKVIPSVTNSHAGNFQRTTTIWTKRGIVRLGFFIRSERARRFRDMAEDLIIHTLEEEAPAEQPSFNLLHEVEDRIRAFPITCKRHVGAYEELLRLHARLTAGEDLAAQSLGGRKKVSEIFLTWLRCIGEMQAAAARRSRTYSNQDIIAMGSPVSPAQTSRYLAQLAGQPVAIYAGHVLIIVPTRTNRQRGWEFRIEKTNGIALVK